MPAAFPPAHGRPLRSAARPVLLLQGPVGPFFDHLASAFMAAGHSVDRVRLNAGDRLFVGRARSRGRDGAPLYRALNYQQGPEAFMPWLRGLCWRNHYAAIVLFGGERPCHAMARQVAAEFGIPVIALEEGYVRSGYVTVERGGNNARSPLVGRRPPAMPPAAPPPLPAHGFRWMLWYAFLAFTWRNAASWPIERRFNHKKRGTIPEGYYWFRNAWRRYTGYGDSVERVMGLASFDLVPLQVADDAQLGEAADGWTNASLIAECIESLARCAPRERHLVFKLHPMERGHSRDLRLVRALARRWGVSARVHCVAMGSLAALTQEARGMITINSTSGMTALATGRPLLVLGRAVYRHPELAQCGTGPASIDRFWTNDWRTDPAYVERFTRWLTAEALVPGDYYDPAVARSTARAVVDRVKALATERAAAAPLRTIGTARRAI